MRLNGVNADVVALSIDPLPDDAPAIVTYFADSVRTSTEMVTSVLRELEKAAIGLFPAWLPGAEGIGAPVNTAEGTPGHAAGGMGHAGERAVGGAAVSAVRALALRLASVTDHFGPFLADLAERSLRGAGRPSVRSTRRSAGFAPEVRAAGLARVLAAGFGRSHASILVRVPAGLSPLAEEVLVTGCEWLAHRGDLGVWLTGAPLATVDRLTSATVRLPAEVAALARTGLPGPPPGARAPRTVTYPAVSGMPHPASGAERALEAALAPCDWAAGRAWNQTHRPHPLASPIRVDLLWRRERCVVEVDGPEHRAPLMFAADRQRDVRLHLDGYTVLRFTNAQVMTDTETVLHQIGRFLRGRRLGTLEGQTCPTER
ncbi:hypothetical protein GCM10017673_28410 [Streptosporangium violaceochromogenes]|nr:hypothetical protein GCM10017673_28410 [Streptosporangium violaceochromogenes]